MAGQVQVFVFGDQTYNASDTLRELLHTHNNPLLTAFLESACQSLKQEVRRLRDEQRSSCPRFAKLVQLVPQWRDGTLNPAFNQALTCICHIGVFIRDHASTERLFPSRHNACISARCTGFLSSVALSCSTSVSQLAVLGVQVVAIAFRVGVCAWEVGSMLYDSSSSTQQYPSWTTAIAGIQQEEVEKAIELFIATKSLSAVKSPYLSARIGSRTCSVSAPPDVLQDFLSTPELTHATKVALSITAPYHAQHLFTSSDVKAIISVGDQTSRDVPCRIPIVSSSTGAVISQISFHDALEIAVEACLRQTIRSDLVVTGLASHLRETPDFIIRYIATPSDGLVSAIAAALDSPKPQHVQAEPAAATSSAELSVPQSRSKIAILAMSGRFPQAPSMEGFWNVIKNGIDTHSLAPISRWNARTHVSNVALKELPKNTSGTGFGCWLEDAAKFDARYFNMSPREAPQVDPAQRLALLTATEALEQAGIVPGRTASTQKDRVGVYFGCTSNDWMETNSAQNIDTYFIPGGNRAFIPGRVNYHFKFSGPSYTIDTACSSSFTAIHLACNALWKGEIDTAIVGGTNVLTNPDMTAGLDRGHFLSRTGNCKTFDDTADGYCRGEAVATAILKRYDDAVADKDPVQACILAIATNHSAEAESITRPHVGAQEDLFQSVLDEAGVNLNEISYCEMHGTGTQAGDAGETSSVVRALAPERPSRSSRESHERLYIGAAKSNVGHGEAAAGVTSLAKVLLMLKNSTIPPHCGIKTKINHRLPDLESRNVAIATESTNWDRPQGGKRTVLLNNFSAAGGNTALVLEDAPVFRTIDDPDPRQFHLIAVSAKTPASLENNLRNLLDWVKQQPSHNGLTLARLSYTTTARRMHHSHRVMIMASDLKFAERSLLDAIERKDGSSRPIGTPRYIFSFTGQGAQFAGMGSELYGQFPRFRADISRYHKICLQLGLPGIQPLFEDPSLFGDAAPTALQLVAVCFQMALYRLWRSLGIQPCAVVGHSLGEYAALYAASVLSQADVIHLVGRRAQLLETHCSQGTHSMLAVRSTVKDLEALLGASGGEYEVSCHNGRESVVLGGSKAQIEILRPSLKRSGMSHRLLEVPYAYHTSQVDPILESLQALANGVSFKKPRIPVISPAMGRVLTSQEDFADDFVVRHCRNKVDMFGAISSAKDLHLVDEKMIGIELGPEPVVVKMVKEIVGPAFRTFASCRRGESSAVLLATALSTFYTAGADIDWSAFHADFESCQVVLDLPAYGWDLKDYWIQYVNDWSLRKGDPPLIVERANLLTSCIHEIVHNTLNSSGGELTVEADLSRPDLNPMVQGHKVYGVPLCTPSVYADIALTIGEYSKRFLGDDQSLNAVEVADMNIQSALVANSDGKPQKIRIVANFDASKQTIFTTFSTVNEDGVIKEQHANCLIRFYDNEGFRKSLRDTYGDVKSRIESIQSRVSNAGNTYRFSKSMIYKMIGQLADFDPKYRALSEITLDSDTFEAVGRVDFSGIQSEGTFNTNPAYIDALSQLGGFVMNGNEGVDLEKELFVNHGWQSLKLFEPVDPAKIYTTHVQMSEGKDKLWTGDVLILHGDVIVGLFGGVALQGVPKRLMSYIVNAASTRANGPKSNVIVEAKRETKSSVVPANVVVKTTKKQSTIVNKPKDGHMITTAVKIISEESGISITELTDDTRFEDVGVDSLLGLMVSSRIRDELDIDIDSNCFLEVSTVGKFKDVLRGMTAGTEQTEVVTEVIEEVANAIDLGTHVSQLVQESSGLWQKVLSIIVEESGVDAKELIGDIYFSDIGVDSLLSLVAVSRMRDELGIDIPEQSLFLDYPTVRGLQKRIVGETQSPSSEQEGSDSDTSTNVSAVFTPAATVETPMEEPLWSVRKDSMISSIAENLPIKAAWSIVLQGSAQKSTKRLFLFPDGCGAATSYLKLPPLSATTSVIAFNSPFMKSPKDMHRRHLSEIVASYVQGVRARQPHGPYHLGGWSAGGILAYAVAQVLMSDGEEIASLSLIDSPPPNNGLDRLPRRFFDHCSAVGIFGEEMSAISSSRTPAPLPDWLMPHFEATIELLHDYKAPPMPKDSPSPQVVNIVWAGSCAFGGKYAPFPSATFQDEDTEGMKFLTEQRVDFGPGLWADLFPGKDINVDVVEGSHHFSMMRGAGGEQLGEILRKAIGIVD
ncbi:hypothetical protein ACN47E_006485 [Coniothyrium glycines]